MTLRLQISAALAFLAASGAIVAAITSYASVEQRLDAETNGFLDDRIAQITSLSQAPQGVERLDRAVSEPDVRADEPDTTGVEGFVRFDAQVAFLNPDGSVIFEISEIRLPADQGQLEAALVADGPIAYQVTVQGRTYETRLVESENVEGDAIIVQVGRDVTEQLQTLRALRSRLLLIVGAVVVVAAAVGSFLANRLVRPLESLRDATRAIADRKDFAHPVKVEGTGEISDVAIDFNLMLHELEESVVQQRRLVQDAGHELRTPLTTVGASLELMQRMGPGYEADHRELLAAANLEIAELGWLVDQLIDLAGSPFDETPVEELDPFEIVEQAVLSLESKSPSRAVIVNRGENRPILGKRNHLERAIANVLANADKFAPVGTSIDVSVQVNVIKIGDRGPGIPDHDLARVFDKFYRSATVQSVTGSGLGLAFVAEVVEAHHGTFRAANRAGGGTEISLELPPAS